MDEQFRELKERLDQLEKLIKTLEGQGVSYYINIEHADIQGPIVDKLDYNFEKLDVKEVSGALNLGNNFGVSVGEIKKKEGGDKSSANSKQSKESAKKKTTSDDRESKGTKTSSSDITQWMNDKAHPEKHEDLASAVVYHTNNTLKLKKGKKTRPSELSEEGTEGKNREAPILEEKKWVDEKIPEKVVIKMGSNNSLKINLRGSSRNNIND